MIARGRWQEVEWPEVDCIITDPPYSARTHTGNNAGRRAAHVASHKPEGRASELRQIDYTHLDHDTAREWGEAWGRRVSAWCAIMCDHTLIPAWLAGMDAAGLYTFAPVPCVITGMTGRLTGDGPSSWAVYLCVGRTRQAHKWGTLPGAYVTGQGANTERRSGRVGGKPLDLMRQIVTDYSRPGMMVADPCAGHATTLAAAHELGRRWWGAECDADSHAAAVARMERVTAQAILPIAESCEQAALFD